MRTYIFPLVVGALLAGGVSAQERFVERTPARKIPPTHNMEQAGFSDQISPHAIPGNTRFDYVGYIGGAKWPHTGGLFSKGPVVSTGPLDTGTFGQDFGGFLGHTGRVFLAPSANPSAGETIARQYRTQGPPVPNLLAWRPIRKLVIAHREGGEGGEHGHAEAGHGESGHGESGHGGEGPEHP